LRKEKPDKIAVWTSKRTADKEALVQSKRATQDIANIRMTAAPTSKVCSFKKAYFSIILFFPLSHNLFKGSPRENVLSVQANLREKKIYKQEAWSNTHKATRTSLIQASRYSMDV
jgi:hypothetical protein